MLEVQKFLENNTIQDLAIRYNISYNVAPFNVVSLNYSNLSPMNEQIVRDCRGLFLEMDSWKLVGKSMPTFFENFEPQGQIDETKINWENAKLIEKLDGALIIMYYHDGEWRIGTRLSADASDKVTAINGMETDLTFAELTKQTIEEMGYTWRKFTKFLHKAYTYSFELVSPETRYGVIYTKRELVLLTITNKYTLREQDIYTFSFAPPIKPTCYNVASKQEIHDLLRQYSDPLKYEGFVLLDGNGKRIKYKNPEYVDLMSSPQTEDELSNIENLLEYVLSFSTGGGGGYSVPQFNPLACPWLQEQGDPMYTQDQYPLHEINSQRCPWVDPAAHWEPVGDMRPAAWLWTGCEIRYWGPDADQDIYNPIPYPWTSPDYPCFGQVPQVAISSIETDFNAQSINDKPELAVQNYLRNGHTLNDLSLTYNIRYDISEELGVVSLNYSNLSPMNETIVKECRALILELNTWNVVAKSMPTFFENFDPQGQIDEVNINWNGAKLIEKLDGALIVMYYYKNDWRIAGRMSPDGSATVTAINGISTELNYNELTRATIQEMGYDWDEYKENLNPDFCYSFELCSPETRYGVIYNERKLVLLSACNVHDLSEKDIFSCSSMPSEKPLYYNVGNKDDIYNILNTYSDPLKYEGFVLLDGNGNRIKYKNPEYISMLSNPAMEDELSNIENLLEYVLSFSTGGAGGYSTPPPPPATCYYLNNTAYGTGPYYCPYFEGFCPFRYNNGYDTPWYDPPYDPIQYCVTVDPPLYIGLDWHVPGSWTDPGNTGG